MRHAAPPAPFEDDYDYAPQQMRKREPQFREPQMRQEARYEQPAPRYEQPLRADFDDHKPREAKPRRAKKLGFIGAMMTRATARPSDAIFVALLAIVSVGIATNILFLQKKETVVAVAKTIPVVQYPQNTFSQPTAVLPSTGGFNQITPTAKPVVQPPVAPKQTAVIAPTKPQTTLGDLTESVSSSKEMNKRLDQTASITMRSEPQKRVSSVQRGLNSVLDTKISVNGTMNSETKNAILKFEEMRRLPPKGEINERLIKELVAVKGTPLE